MHQISINEIGPPIKAMRNFYSQGLALAIWTEMPHRWNWDLIADSLEMVPSASLVNIKYMYMQEAKSPLEGVDLGWRVIESHTIR